MTHHTIGFGIVLTALFAALTGCGTQVGTEELYGCIVVSTEAIDDLDTAPDGFTTTPRDAMTAALGSFSGPLTLEAGGDDLILSLQLDEPGAIEVQRRELRTDGREPAAMEPECEDAYAFTARFTVRATPALDEQAEGTVEVDARDQAAIVLSIPFEDLVGDAQPTFDPETLENVALNLFAGGGSSGVYNGQISFFGETTGDPNDPDSAVSATLDPFAGFDVNRDVAE